MRPNTRGTASAGRSGRALTASSTAIALAKAYAISCTGVAPASCRWYEQMLIGFHFGIASTVNAIMSLIRRIDGSGGNTYVPRDRYSFTMSFCVVPESLLAATPCRSAAAT